VTPDLAALLEHPEKTAGLDPSAVPELLAEVEAIRARLWSRLHRPSGSTPSTNGSPPPPLPDQLLTADEAGAILAVDKRWLYDHANDLPFTRRLSPGKLRFSERGLERWLRTR